MKRIESCFAKLKESGRKGLITFITAGDPGLDATPELVKALEAGGADLVELGVPFSDPLADGPTIELASNRALRAGTTLKGVLATVRKIRRSSEIPLVLMSYCNPLYRYGLEKLVGEAVAAGVDGFIVPDLPLEEAARLREIAADRLAVIPLAAPTTPPERLERIVAAGRGFLYYVSVTGITGARSQLPADLAAALERVGEKSVGRLPLAVGFGIATPAQAQIAAARADAVIVGSALVEIIARRGAGAEGRRELREKVKALRAALDQVKG